MKIEEIEQNSFEDLRGGGGGRITSKKTFYAEEDRRIPSSQLRGGRNSNMREPLFIALSFLTGTKYG